MLFYLLVFFSIIALFLFVQKVVYKSRLQKSLGRRVEDRELTSLTSWMEATPAEEPGRSEIPKQRGA